MEKGKVLPGLFYAKNVMAKVRYPQSGEKKIIKDTSTNKHTSPFAIEFIHTDKKLELWDLNSFRPDFRDSINIFKQLSREDGLEIIVLYETVKYTNKKVMIPRYIVTEGVSFINIR